MTYGCCMPLGRHMQLWWMPVNTSHKDPVQSADNAAMLSFALVSEWLPVEVQQWDDECLMFSGWAGEIMTQVWASCQEVNHAHKEIRPPILLEGEQID